MGNWFKALDRVLRGEATQVPALREGRVDVPVAGLGLILIALGMVYGACMGVYAVLQRWGTPTAEMGWQQMAASAVKVPLLFLLTLVITFPSLYVFNALVGSRLTIGSVLRLLVAALAVMMAVLASFGPIVAFFAICTKSYAFMKLLNVAVFAVAGFLGLGFLLRTLQRLTAVQFPTPAQPLPPPSLDDAEAVEPLPPGDLPPESLPPPPFQPPYRPGALAPMRGPTPNVRMVFQIWVLVFGLVGAQMAWVLRPFVGNPDQPFSFFRPRGSNFFQGVLNAIQNLTLGR